MGAQGARHHALVFAATSHSSERKLYSPKESSLQRLRCDLTQALAIRVRQVRLARGWTQEELAHRVGLSASYIGEIERHHASPTVNVLGGLARAFWVDPVELLKRAPKRGKHGR
jgi:XRE family transcriptional regulator, regulator of sulfur utilization